MLKTESNKPLTSESEKETSPKVRPVIDYDKMYQNCRPVPDLYCIHSESKLAECPYIPKMDSALQES